MLVNGAQLFIWVLSRVLAEVLWRDDSFMGSLAALWMGVWLVSDVQKEARWQCSRSLLAGGALARETGGDENVLHPGCGSCFSPPSVRLSAFLPKRACGMWDFTKSGLEKHNPANQITGTAGTICQNSHSKDICKTAFLKEKKKSLCHYVWYCR